MSTAVAVTGIIGSAVLILGGLVAVARSTWRAAQDMRDNKLATQANTRALHELKDTLFPRLARLERRVDRIEHRGPVPAPENPNRRT